MARKILIEKATGATVVTVWDTKKPDNKRSYAYNLGANFFLENGVIQLDDKALIHPRLTFVLADLDDNLGAADIEAYFTLMVESLFFLASSGGGIGEEADLQSVVDAGNIAQYDAGLTYTLLPREDSRQFEVLITDPTTQNYSDTHTNWNHFFQEMMLRETAPDEYIFNSIRSDELGISLKNYRNSSLDDTVISSAALKVTPDGVQYSTNPDSNIFATVSTSNLTSNRGYAEPDMSGTRALVEYTIPITGTQESNPVTGPIEFAGVVSVDDENNMYYEGSISKQSIAFDSDTENLTLKVASNANIEDRSSVEISYNQVALYSGDNDTDVSSSLLITPTMISVLSGNTTPLTDSRGITSEHDFTPNIQELDFTQKKYVDSILPQVADDFLDDAAAAIGGIEVGRLYHTSGVVKLRLV